ncbi:uncharacterized protein JCM6883_001441 [Sporobolomyces salmoneus]|uniref:uncharacterized protein n=1 Tax=Sporobolomyces salmoneus TaxID=183962 RepID=UPI00317D32A7
MCCTGAQWKREVVPDHKFDFIDVKEFHSSGCGTQLQYGWLWILFVKSIAVYIADIYTLVALLASNRWAASILQSEAAQGSSASSNVLEVPFSIGKWIFFGCIIFSFLLLLWEARKARAIVKSRDISYAFTNVMSQNWYALRSYDHFCFFCQIDNSKKKKDEFAFFIFFTFKGWKRLLLADAPRQVINAITLYSFGKSENFTTDLSVYFSGSILRDGVIVTMVFTVVMWLGSALLLLIAAICYVPLLCYIQGNLKEYCCHKVDKRIAELMKRKNRKRLAKEAEIARKEARGDFSHLKDRKTGKLRANPLPQPTLPDLKNLDLYSDDKDSDSILHQHQHQNSIPYGYPPTAPSRALSNRNIYPYASSDSESLHSIPTYPLQASHRNLSYADSIHSTDGLTSMAAPFGAGGGGYYGSESQLNLAGGGVPMRAPSYRTMPSEQSLPGAAGGWDEKGASYRQDSVDSFHSYPQQPPLQPSNGMNGGVYGNEMSWEESYGGGGQSQQFYGEDSSTVRGTPPPRNAPSRGPEPSNFGGSGRQWGYGR